MRVILYTPTGEMSREPESLTANPEPLTAQPGSTVGETPLSGDRASADRGLLLDPAGHDRVEIELTLEAEPDAVRRARHFVRTSLGDSWSQRDDVGLVVSELITNAMLHGEAPIHVRLVANTDRLRIEVRDAGQTPPLLIQAGPDAMTGRGLALVNSLAGRWGVDPVPGGGKVVWVELARLRVQMPGGAKSGAQSGARSEAEVDPLLPSWTAGDPNLATYLVRLGSVATRFLTAAKSHLDDVVRELTLMREGKASSGEELPPELSELVDVVTGEFSAARAELKREAAGAAARGEVTTDLVLHLPTEAADAGERYLAALEQIDRYARSARLLTLAPPPEHRIFRRWYVTALVEQLRSRARGEAPPPVRPFDLVLAEEVARLAPLEQVSARLALLQRVNRKLAEATDRQDMAEIVVTAAMNFLEVEEAGVRLLDEDGAFLSMVRRERRAPVSQENKEQEEGDEGFDRLTEHSGHTRLLAVANREFGWLDVIFTAGVLSDEAEQEVVASLADTLAQALARAELMKSEETKRETLALLSEASQILTSTREPTEVLEELVELSVPRLADWCTVYLAEGNALRRAAMSIGGFPEAARQFIGSPLSLDLDVPQTRAFLTGLPQEITGGAGRLLDRLYPFLDFAALGGDTDTASGLCQPIVMRGEVVGVIAVTFLGSGRKVTAAVVEALEGLAARAAVALDNARRWTAQNELVQSLVAALLPAEPPTVAGLAFAARYLPAGGDVAGDWWEADVLADGSVLVGLGDAAGHGVAAVSDMCELRHGARALATVEPNPALLLADLNRRLAHVDAGLATAVYGRLRPETGQLRWACAGHVPPLHVSAAGQVTILDSSRTAPLGIPGELAITEAGLTLEPGDTLVLYSDGVVERKDENLEDGIKGLAATAGAHAGDPVDALADAIIARHFVQPIDDCCLMLVRREVGNTAGSNAGTDPTMSADR